MADEKQQLSISQILLYVALSSTAGGVSGLATQITTHTPQTEQIQKLEQVIDRRLRNIEERLDKQFSWLKDLEVRTAVCCFDKDKGSR